MYMHQVYTNVQCRVGQKMRFQFGIIYENRSGLDNRYTYMWLGGIEVMLMFSHKTGLTKKTIKPKPFLVTAFLSGIYVVHN